ncbi:terminase large subunit domain-containing protein [Ectothiorhodospira mobilis]|uniref:terminase large subunit domain-containing protein n=1 Tax=Ectothiorhodospira mobilis TaxID=195064 RepID=UPI0019081643|nr:terminase family protein [Ectothiorhodospira mobilis]MBK1690990.1 hypothetical protein [Ectothiorhodospira mobilis]
MARPSKWSEADRRHAYERYIAGDNAAEIARDLGASAATVRNWVRKGDWNTERARLRQSPEHLEAEIARLSAKAGEGELTYAQTVQLSMLQKTLDKMRKAKPQPKPRPIVAQAMREDLLAKALSDDYGLLPYQKEFLQDESRYRVVLKARQIGFTYLIGLSAVLGMAAGRDQVIVSASEDQAKLVMGNILHHAERLEVPIEEGKDREVRVAGARATALSTNWRTAQGYTGDVWFDEFAWAPRPDRLWGAVTPAITRVGGRITVCSTPFTPGSLFWKIAENHKGQWEHFSRHKITIHDAVAQGMPMPGGIEELRLNFDAATWALFYECQWAEDGSNLLPWSLLETIGSPEDPLEEPGAGKSRTRVDRFGRLALGVDVGRVNDRTALVLVGEECDPVTGAFTGKLRVLRWHELAGQTFAAQRAEIANWVASYPIERVAIDRTGLGMQLAEELAGDFPSLVEPRAFTAALKERLALGVLRLAESHHLAIPRDPDFMARLHSVERQATNTGIRFDAPRDSRGHADAFWALALACERSFPETRRAAVEVW